MKIIIISGFFYPQNTPRAFRTTELVKEFVRLGHNVTLFVPEMEYNLSDFLRTFPITVKYYQEMPERRKFVGISIVDRAIFHYEHWLINSPSLSSMRNVQQAVRGELGYDLLITIAVPHYIHWAVGKIYAKDHKIAKTWVADCGDPFMLAETDTHKPPFWFKPLEKEWCISVPTEMSYMGYYPEFRNKIQVIPQGFNFEDISIPVYKKNEVPTFAFAGNLIKNKRDPRLFMDWLSTIDMPFLFWAYGNNVRPFLEPYQRRLGEKLVIKDPIPRDQLLPLLAKMDFLINIGNGTKVQTPSKLIDYSLSKRPIITIESDDIKTDFMMEFFNGNYSHKDNEIDISKYNIHNVAQHFLDLTD